MNDDFIPVARPWWFTNFGALLSLAILAARFRHRGVRTLFAVSVAVHIAEASYTYKAAHTAGFTRSARKWTLQTLAVGGPSLFALRRARRSVHVGP